MPLSLLKTLRSQHGFSLLEVMTVVAIVGILAAIAVPNMQRYARTAKQNEAKSSLASIYSAEKTFRADQGFYTGCLWQAGYRPSIGGRLYMTGFYNAIVSWDYDRSQVPYLTCTNTPGIPFGSSIRNDATFPPSSADWTNLSPTTIGNPDDNHYTANADGYLGGVTDDLWTIDQDQNLTNLRSGL